MERRSIDTGSPGTSREDTVTMPMRGPRLATPRLEIFYRVVESSSLPSDIV